MKKLLIVFVVLIVFLLDLAALHDIFHNEPQPYEEYLLLLFSFFFFLFLILRQVTLALITFLILTAFSLITFSLYLYRKTQPPKSITPPMKDYTLSELPQDRVSCLGHGGRWKKIGLSPKESCNIPTTDAGKECLNQEDCQGACLADLSESNRQKAIEGVIIKTKGKCTPWLITVGCQARVEKGKVSGILCLD